MGRFDLFFFNVLAPALSVVLLVFASQGIGPAWQARWGSGSPGFFLAVHKHCGKSCSWTGDFTGDDGRRRQAVGLGTGYGPSAVGDEVPAVDTGDSNNVFPKGGGHDWLLTGGLALVALAYLFFWGRTVWRWSRRCRQR